MLTSDKIIDIITKLNDGKFIFECAGKEEEFVKNYINFKKYQLSLKNKKNSNLEKILEWDNELHHRYLKWSRICKIRQIC